MRSDQFSNRYTPTSPLSPKLPVDNRPISPQPNRNRPGHTRTASRNLHMPLPRYHPANFQHHEAAATPTSTAQSPAITLNRVNQPSNMDSPRLMREKQREFLDRALKSSQIAASPMAIKPGSPRLDPLGSPKGVVTPLMLEETQDYFAVTGTGKRSPATSPGGRSTRSDGSGGKEDPNLPRRRSVEVYR